jgi:hypothetical protein
MKLRDRLENTDVNERIILNKTKEIYWDGAAWIDLAQNMKKWLVFMNRIMNLGVPPKARNFSLDQRGIVRFSGRTVYGVGYFSGVWRSLETNGSSTAQQINRMVWESKVSYSSRQPVSTNQPDYSNPRFVPCLGSIFNFVPQDVNWHYGQPATAGEGLRLNGPWPHFPWL